MRIHKSIHVDYGISTSRFGEYSIVDDPLPFLEQAIGKPLVYCTKLNGSSSNETVKTEMLHPFTRSGHFPMWIEKWNVLQYRINQSDARIIAVKAGDSKYRIQCMYVCVHSWRETQGLKLVKGVCLLNKIFQWYKFVMHVKRTRISHWKITPRVPVHW